MNTNNNYKKAIINDLKKERKISNKLKKLIKFFDNLFSYTTKLIIQLRQMFIIVFIL